MLKTAFFYAFSSLFWLELVQFGLFLFKKV